MQQEWQWLEGMDAGVVYAGIEKTSTVDEHRWAEGWKR